jgi:hypothetical protein
MNLTSNTLAFMLGTTTWFLSKKKMESGKMKWWKMLPSNQSMISKKKQTTYCRATQISPLKWSSSSSGNTAVIQLSKATLQIFKNSKTMFSSAYLSLTYAIKRNSLQKWPKRCTFRFTGKFLRPYATISSLLWNRLKKNWWWPTYLIKSSKRFISQSGNALKTFAKIFTILWWTKVSPKR